MGCVRGWEPYGSSPCPCEHRYGELLQEWQTGRRTSVCPTGLWQAKYTKMHAEVSRLWVREDSLELTLFIRR